MNSADWLADNLIFDAVFNNIGIGVAIVDVNGHLLKVNSVFENMLGYSESELKQLEVQQFTHQDDYEADYAQYQTLLKGETKSYSIKKRYIHKSGKIIWVKLIVSVIRDEKNKPLFAVALVDDLTENILFEDKLEKEKELTRALLDNSPDSIYFKDTQSRFILVNKATLKKFGFTTEDEIIGKTDLELFSGEHAKEALEDEKKIIETGKSIISKEELETWNDGTITWVSTSKIPYYDKENKIVGLFGITRDITANKKYEATIKENEARYKLLSEVTFEGILIHDKGVVKDVNSALCIMLGYEYDELLGQNIIEICIRNEDRQIAYDNIKNRVTKPYEVIGLRKNGEEFVAEIEAREAEIENKVLRIVAVRDITERRKNENIQSALYKISQAVNTIDDINELYGHIHEIIKTLMPADNFYIALHDKDSEYITFPYFVDKYDPPPPPHRFERGLTEYILRTGKDMLINAELDLKLREEGETNLIGEPCKIWLGVVLLNKGEIIGAIVVQDYENEDTYGEPEKELLTFVSEQIAFAIDKKQNEDKLKTYSRELQELIASKDKFFSIVAHDLKSPFTALLGYSEVIANEYNEMSKNELRDFAQNMNDVAKKTFTLLENLLEWSRVQTGRMKYDPENLGVFQTVQQVLDLYIDNAKKKGVVLRNRVHPAHEINADANMIFTILRNLISNAIKFTKSDDEVTISSRDLGKLIEITVKDTGVGISKEDQEKLFRIDIHHSEIGTEQEKGTGLGLILCKELVEKNGGSIKIESQLGKGSSFIFTINKSNSF